MKKKIISLLLAIAMLIVALPVSVLATMLTVDEIDAALVLSGYTDSEIKAMPLQTVLDLLQDSDGNQIEIDENATVVWTHFKDDEGNVIRDEYHEIDRDETVDLSEFSYTSGYTLELIIGSGKQLDPNNKRYIVRVYMTDNYNENISFDIYTSDGQKIEPLSKEFASTDSTITSGNGTAVPLWGYFYTIPEGVYSGLKIVMHSELAERPDVDVNVYEYSEYMQNEEAGYEIYPAITDEILNKNSDDNNFGWSVRDTTSAFFVTYDIDGISDIIMAALFITGGYINITGDLYIDADGENNAITQSEVMSVEIDSESEENDIYELEYTLNNGYSADELYYCCLNAYNTNTGNLYNKIEKVVVGHYDTLQEAENCEDIKDLLFNSDAGYQANYGGEGVKFTVFFEDGVLNDLTSYKIKVKAVESDYIMPDFDSAPIVGAQDPYFRVDGVIQNNEALDCYIIENGKAINMDTLYGYGYQTIFINDTDVDLSKLQPTFWFGNDERVHTTYVGVKQESGVSVQDFSDGAVQYGTIIDNNTKNYNVTFVKKENGPKLYVNGPSQREILLDEYFENKHDILIANVGDEPLTGISVELNATNVKLDDYWTVGGTDNDTLAAFTTTESDSDYGELNNIGKIRLLPDGEGDIEGTLTISADGQEDVVINLTGRASNPQIVTDSLEEYHAVKYVPYAYLVSTNNMNDWNNVSFKLISGSLPNGVTLNESTGEVYGVPTETGEFTFTVQADYSYEGFESSQQELTLTVDENTDENVAAQIDEGYEIKVAIPETVTGETDIVWEIEYDYNDETASEFQGVWLDGEKLVVDTDYTVEPGSTKITVKSQTVGSTSDGSHTISAEYRTSDNNELKKSAQNYTKSSSGSNSSSSSSSSSSRSSGSSTPSSYKVWFEVNGGAWLDALTVTRNTTADLPTPERYGYAFGGWYTDEGLTQLFDVNTKINKTTTLYAKWIPLYTIWFEECGGEDVADITVQEGNTAGTLPTPVREGYVFLGWYKDEILTQEYDGTEAVSESIAIFAKWIEDTPPVDASGFIDVDANDWFFSDVEWVYGEQFMVGTSNITFEPNEAVTGGMVVTVLARLADADVSEYEDMTFEDVYEDQWYTPYAKWAKAIGLVDGIPFNPPEEISREAMGVILARFIDYMDAEYEIDDEEIVFADSELISPEAADSMQTLFKLEIFKGKGDNIIDPLSNTTRAEYAALIHRINEFLEDNAE